MKVGVENINTILLPLVKNLLFFVCLWDLNTVSVTLHNLACENVFVARVKKTYRLADINKPIKAELTLRGKAVSGIYGITGV